MAETPETDKLVKVEPEGPAPDPITSRTTSSILLISALLLTAVLAWALWDEVYSQRPWKSMQQSFVKRYDRYLKRLQRRGNPTEQEVKQSDEYLRLDADYKQAAAAADPRKNEIDRRVESIDRQLAAVTDPFQEKRGRITVINYRIETSDESGKESLRREAEQMKREQVKILMPAADGAGRPSEQKLDFAQIEKLYNDLKDEKARLLSERGEILKESQEAARKRDDYLKDNMIGLGAQQISSLRNKVENFDYTLRQINVASVDLVDRCETCHLGIREPVRITAADMMPRGRRPDRLARAFVSHPSKELLQIHDPDRFGCSSCHGGNGRATTSVVKGHGRHRFWLHPLHEKENMEAGCQQCHMNDRVLQGAPTLTLGKDLFYQRGCVGCHRYEGFDRETDALASTRQSIKQLEEQISNNEREARAARDESGKTASDEEAQKLLARAESLTVTNSQIESRVHELNLQSRYLMQDQKKVGPNLKDVRLKLRKEWIPVWLRNPQEFRPGTKMPTYWYLSRNEREDRERQAIAAYLWQTAFDGQIPQQPTGDAAKGKALFESTGCLACHSIGEGDQRLGGDFAANLQRLGEKANYNYIVRWIHNPRERFAPYCPKEKRDLSAADYEQHQQPFIFDTKHTRCPNDGAELQVQNMTVMPNFRLSDADARDIATYLVSLSSGAQYPNADFMDDPALKETGRQLIKSYGCAGCHEIRGFEDEQRIGKELTTEGATPIERLDFALQTHRAEMGLDPYDENKKTKPWYDHKGFFENKLEDPNVYDLGKEKDPKDHLRMPKPYLTPEWKNALTTFLLGSVGVEGANVPTSFFYNPSNMQKDIQDGWWVIKKYNCMGCHSVQVGQRSVLSSLALYQEGGPLGRDQLPPGLTSEGARVDPDWLLRFLRDPSLSGWSDDELSANAQHSTGAGGSGSSAGAQGAAGATRAQNAQGNSQQRNAQQQAAQAANVGGDPHAALKPQPGMNRNGVRTYLRARMPTFSFSPNELRTLVRFFLAVSAQQEPFIREPIDPLSDGEMNLARALFTSQAAPCLKCHMTGDPGHDQTATAPNFLQAGSRLKPGWTFRWLLDPQRIMPGTAMPSQLFKKEGERWVFNGPLPESAATYDGDHARLLTRYLLQLTEAEQSRVSHAAPTATSGSPPAPVASHGGSQAPASAPPASRRRTQSAGARARARPRHGQQISHYAPTRRRPSAARAALPRTVARA